MLSKLAVSTMFLFPISSFAGEVTFGGGDQIDSRAVVEDIALEELDLSLEQGNMEGSKSRRGHGKKPAKVPYRVKKVFKSAAKATVRTATTVLKVTAPVRAASGLYTAMDKSAEATWAVVNLQTDGAAGPYPGLKEAALIPLATKIID